MIGLNVMEWRVGILIRIDPLRIISTMIAIIPTPRAQVQSAQEFNRARYHGEFLMMDVSQTMAIIKPEREPVVGGPVEIPFLKPFAIDSVDGIEIPSEHVNLQVFILLANPVQERVQAHLIAVCGIVPTQ